MNLIDRKVLQFLCEIKFDTQCVSFRSMEFWPPLLEQKIKVSRLNLESSMNFVRSPIFSLSFIGHSINKSRYIFDWFKLHFFLV